MKKDVTNDMNNIISKVEKLAQECQNETYQSQYLLRQREYYENIKYKAHQYAINDIESICLGIIALFLAILILSNIQIAIPLFIANIITTITLPQIRAYKFLKRYGLNQIELVKRINKLDKDISISSEKLNEISKNLINQKEDINDIENTMDTLSNDQIDSLKDRVDKLIELKNSIIKIDDVGKDKVKEKSLKKEKM